MNLGVQDIESPTIPDTGTYMPFSEEFKKAVREVGIPAFAKGGHVEIPLPKIQTIWRYRISLILK